MNTIAAVSICDWCLREASLQPIEEYLWLVWKLLSKEDPTVVSFKNICESCKSRFEKYSMYISAWKINASIIDKILASSHVKDEPSIDIEYNPLFKKEVSEERQSNSSHLTVSGVVAIEHQVLPGCSKFPDEPMKFYEEVSSFKKAHIGERSFKCSRCNRIFNFSTTLKDHICIHPDQKPFKCTLCNKTFIRAYSLKTHIRTHTRERPFKCTTCSKAFSNSSSVKNHMDVHTGERPFKCFLCNKTFVRSVDLKGHIAIHIGERRFKCSLCIKTFIRSSHLKRHMHIHSSERGFKCSLCIKTFICFSDLKRHMYIHTDEKPFKCTFCNKMFARSNYLKRHMHQHISAPR